MRDLSTIRAASTTRTLFFSGGCVLVVVFIQAAAGAAALNVWKRCVGSDSDGRLAGLSSLDQELRM